MNTHRVFTSILHTFRDERVQILSKLDLLRLQERKGYFAIETEHALELLCAHGTLLEEPRDDGKHFRIAPEEQLRLTRSRSPGQAGSSGGSPDPGELQERGGGHDAPGR